MNTTAVSSPARPVTDKQLAFIRSLLAERQDNEAAEIIREHLNDARIAGLLDAPTASVAISRLLAIPKTTTAQVPDLEDGIYRADDGEIVKVYHTIHGRNVQVGKRLSVRGNGDGTFTGEFVYVGKSALIGLTPAHRLDHASAAEFGKIYGFCVNCGLELSDERSVASGYGATCARNNGWPYPTKKELRLAAAVAVG